MWSKKKQNILGGHPPVSPPPPAVRHLFFFGAGFVAVARRRCGTRLLWRAVVRHRRRCSSRSAKKKNEEKKVGTTDSRGTFEGTIQPYSFDYYQYEPRRARALHQRSRGCRVIMGGGEGYSITAPTVLVRGRHSRRCLCRCRRRLLYRRCLFSFERTQKFVS